MPSLLLAILSTAVAGSLVYCILTVVAALCYRAVRPRNLRNPVPISVLKPLSGADEGLDENLATFFLQDYHEFEILFAVHEADDPAVAVVQKLRRRFSTIPVRLIVNGEPPYPNAKVFSLVRMSSEARHPFLVLSDSDVRVTPRMLRTIASEFQDERVGLVTCPYRAVPGHSFWSTLEAIGMNTGFLGGVLVARMLEGMRFALGAAIAVRRELVERMGGFHNLKDYLADDFIIGKLAAEHGYKVVLSSQIVEHHIGTQRFRTNLEHRLRWARSTRCSRPRGYWGEIFTNPVPLALLLWSLKLVWWPLLLLTVLVRTAAAGLVAGVVLDDSLIQKRWWLIPIEDIVTFAVWIAGFFGNRIRWRGRWYCLFPDGRLEPVR